MAVSHPVWGAWIETDFESPCNFVQVSHPVWGAWIETAHAKVANDTIQSHPVWGAWIETSDLIKRLQSLCRTPCGVRGLKQRREHKSYEDQQGRTPCGVRGLKLGQSNYHTAQSKVAPRVGCVD